MQFILPFLFIAVFCFLIWKAHFFAVPGLNRTQLIGLFALKCAAGMVVWYIYTWYQPGSDFQIYFNSSREIMHHLFAGSTGNVAGWNGNFEDAFYLNSRLIILTNVILHFISFNSIFVHIICFCFLAFTGLVALYKALIVHFSEKKKALVIGIFFVPSVLFWTSGIYKETFAFFFLGLFLYYTEFGLRKKYDARTTVLCVVCLSALLFIKAHLVAALLPVFLVNVIVSHSEKIKLWMATVLVFIPGVLLVYSTSMMSDSVNVFKLIADRQAKAISEAEGGTFLLNNKNFVRVDYYDEDALILNSDSTYSIREGTSYLSWELDNMKDTTFATASADSISYKLLYKVCPANTVVDLRHIQPNFVSILKNLPAAIGNVLFQPNLFSSGNLLQMSAAVENLWVLLLIVLSLLFFDRTSKSGTRIIWFCVLFALIQVAMIGITTPAVGAIVRYKSLALPFLVMAVLIKVDTARLRKKIFRADQDSGTK